MKLTYASVFDATNLNNWSGLGYYYGVMLEQAGFDLNYLNNLNTPFQSLHSMKQHLVKRMAGKLYSRHFNINVSKTYAQIIQKKLGAGSAIFSPNTIVLAHLGSEYKRILYADATLERLLHLYPNYSNLTKQCVIEGHEIDRQAIHNSDLLIYSSQWAADSAINFYNADPKKISIAPFGANLKSVPAYCDIKNIIKKRASNNEIHILFLGVDWIRKGGDKALEVINRLNENGLKATLHIAGIKGKLPINEQNNIVNHGFIGKDSIDGEEKLAELFSTCHFLLLPTIADCTPVVFSEANAFGMPCITTNVGGNSCIVRNDINGKVFDPSIFIEEAVDYIQEITQSTQKYEQLCLSSYDRYCTELNWTTTGKKIFKLINDL
ncbi:glycosyltransferase family 4 protein [Chitinophagaceae bacterium LB-8]|uniref:Glycosyltransferase family 4 protein n=1 Tax=Paraflavisolibacter caeni TaxID=2982496 RepID=A0A9X2XPD7_9BACT|nr:glycosyltransferase family 4 protein [Paraflavisolibacter caeni]MCU7550619.1 glycosyltransferase family 4 protein [Paraflavisolibacter caeni]